MSAEEWRPVRGWPNYEVSSLGRVMSYAQRKPRLMTLRMARCRRYLDVCLWDKGRTRSFLVHRLVAETFLGPSPEGKPEVRHLDGDGFNNDATNLSWGSRSENILDTVRHGTHSQASKTRCHRGHPLTEENVYRSASGSRDCRLCRRRRHLAHESRVRATAVAAWFAAGQAER